MPLELIVGRIFLIWIAILLIAIIIGLWLAYWVLKCAIRDGIRESELKGWWQVEPTFGKEPERLETPKAPSGYRWELVRTETKK